MDQEALFPVEVLRFGVFSITDTLLWSVILSAALIAGGALALRSESARRVLEIGYDALERQIVGMVSEDVRPMVPLVLTQWIFVAAANLLGLVPGVGSPTRDLSITTALALIAFASGHYFAFRNRGLSYLRTYLEPHALLLPFNVIGELSRTLALSLRLFGNMLSGQLILAVLVYLVGLLVPLPLMLLSVLTSVVQAYIFGVLTLVFAASSMQAAGAQMRRTETESSR